MKKLILIIVIFFFILSPLQSKGYYTYTYKTFAKLPAANKRINFKKINYKLLDAAIFYETCRQRAIRKLPVFKHSIALEKAAFGHSRDMVVKKFFSHNSKIKGKYSMEQRLALVGIKNTYAAENISYTFGIEYKQNSTIPKPKKGVFKYRNGKIIKNHTYLSLGKSFVEGWMDSPGHRANILNRKFKYLGCGAYYYRDSKFYNIPMFKGTQNFSAKDFSATK